MDDARRISRTGSLGPMAAVLLAAAVSSGVAGCGDDSDSVSDAGPDASNDGDGVPFDRRPGGKTFSGDAIPLCQRFDPLGCSAGLICQVVIARAPTEADFSIYTGCIEGGDARGLGDPCEPWGGWLTAYRTEGLAEEVYVDPCQEGLFCGLDPVVRGAYSCQPACDTQLRQGCSDARAYCSGTDAYQQTCRLSDACDPHDPDACGAGRGCFLRVNDTATGALSLCLPLVEEPVADGQPCRFINACHPGSSCFGPALLPVSQWNGDNSLCRRVCDPGEAPDLDAGADDDAGAASTDAGSGGTDSACLGATECVDLEGSGGWAELATLEQRVGLCE
ncbi:MAG: hypothetical protein OEZ06_24970 [Myxococcales bacterium]|nr:hypothetical protein [Myxococcales bacterium]